MTLYDAFICHASEDKESFVRKLANELRRNNIHVWYDEFSLEVGDSLRRSIDLGLSTSRFGIVVLSKAFFSKQWPAWELDGLVEKELVFAQKVILPIWLGIGEEEVRQYSPSLANKYAVKADSGYAAIVEQLGRVIRPQGSSLIVARNILIDKGLDPPVVTDDWWHFAIEYSGSNPMEGTFQDAMGWGRWGFPLPEPGQTTSEKGSRIAWAAMQLAWQSEAERAQITQITHPQDVHGFISRMHGLGERCADFPQYLASFAPQLTIRGFGGPFEGIFDNWLASSREKYTREPRRYADRKKGKTISCDELIALHDDHFGNHKAGAVACNFVSGQLHGPEVRVYETLDYCIWLLSRQSSWMPEKIRNFLIQGMREWAVWHSESNPPKKYISDFLSKLWNHEIENSLSIPQCSKDALDARIEATITLLHLPEKAPTLRNRFLQNRFIEQFLKEVEETKKRRQV